MSPRLALVIASLMLAMNSVGDVWAGPPADQIRLQIDRVIDVLADPALKAAGASQNVRPRCEGSRRRSSTSAR
jgi:hypothetical protein